MTQKLIPLGIGIALSCAYPTFLAAQQQDAATAKNPSEIVITADRVPYPKTQVASSVTVITAEQIKASQQQTVGEILRGVPGVDVVQSGGPGGNVSVFIRGANSEHTLVIVDGIESNDPISPTRAFDFANFSLDNIDRIEVIRGPASVLYGSDAIGGVILITTKKGSGPLQTTVSAEGGSFGSSTERASVSGGAEETSYSLAASQRNRDGFSSADRRDGNTEDDGYAATNVATQLSHQLSQTVEGSLVFRYGHSRSELDNYGGVGGDDPNRILYDSQILTRGQLATNFFGGVLKQKLGMSFTNQWYDDDNGVDLLHPVDSTKSNFVGKNKKIDLQNIIAATDALDITLGYENETEQGSASYESQSAFGPYIDILDDTSVTNNGYYAQGRYKFDEAVIATASSRIDDHSVFGTQSTWRVGPTFLIGDTKLAGTMGTGYKAPSIFQLYSSYGNRNLKPEESMGWDVTVEQSLFKKNTTIGATYFHNDFDDLITFNPATFQSENIAKARSSGVEVFSTSRVVRDLYLDLSYTMTNTEDLATGERLLRRARNKAKAAVRYQASERTELGLEMLMNGKRLDNDFSTYPATPVDLGGYVLVNLTGRYRITDALELFGRAENLLDQKYQEVKGFGTQGAAVFGGLSFDL
jgi:vitamin B12 transporter